MNYRVLSYSLLAQDVYNPRLLPMQSKLSFHGWQRVDIITRLPHFSAGFYAMLYAKSDIGSALENTFVIAYRGTVLDTWRHIRTNLHEDKEILEHKEPDYYPVARQFYYDVEHYIQDRFVNRGVIDGFNIKLTGHSLGGTLAKLVGARTNTPAISFNGPGIGLWVPENKNYDNLILNINSEDGYINKYGPSVGLVKSIDVPEGNLNCHAINAQNEEIMQAKAVGNGGVLGSRVANSTICALEQHRIANMVNAIEKDHSIAGMRF